MKIGHLRIGISPWENSLIQVHAIALHLWKDRSLGWNPVSRENRCFSIAFLWAQVTPRMWCYICRTVATAVQPLYLQEMGRRARQRGLHHHPSAASHRRAHPGRNCPKYSFVPLGGAHLRVPWMCCTQSSSLWFASEVSISSVFSQETH